MLKQMITSSSSQNISDLVFGNLVIPNWSANNLVNTDHFEIIQKIFLRDFSGHLDHWNWSSIPRVIVPMKFVTLSFLLVQALLRSYLIFGKLWKKIFLQLFACIL